LIEIKASFGPPGSITAATRNRKGLAMKKTTTWVLLADHERAHVLANDGPGRGLQPVDGMEFSTELHRAGELMTDRLPRSVNSQTGMRHGIEPRIDPHRQEAAKFVAQVAQAVSSAAARHQFDRLILVAPPRALGELRDALPQQVRARIHAELDLDLTRASMTDVEAHLASSLAV
jgi:protein required for attachment to host cells